MRHIQPEVGAQHFMPWLSNDKILRDYTSVPADTFTSKFFKNRFGTVFIQHRALPAHIILALGVRHYQRHFRRSTTPQRRHSTTRLPTWNDPSHTLISIRQTDGAIGGTR